MEAKPNALQSGRVHVVPPDDGYLPLPTFVCRIDDAHPRVPVAARLRVRLRRALRRLKFR